MLSGRWPALLLFIAVTLAVASIGALATNSSVATWYPTLNKPAWNPPGWVFGPVWSALYLMMATAAWRVSSHTENPARRSALTWFFVQLGLNALWSCLFFGLRNPGLAFAEILVLWTILIVVLVKFARIDLLATVLWLPYLAWVSFASVLNGAVWWLNR
jgi:benzodiazapine receptor